jgi:hypothetical protein
MYAYVYYTSDEYLRQEKPKTETVLHRHRYLPNPHTQRLFALLDLACM